MGILWKTCMLVMGIAAIVLCIQFGSIFAGGLGCIVLFLYNKFMEKTDNSGFGQ